MITIIPTGSLESCQEKIISIETTADLYYVINSIAPMHSHCAVAAIGRSDWSIYLLDRWIEAIALKPLIAGQF